MCFPSNAHPSARSWHLEQWDLPPLWPQSCHPSMQPSSMQGPTVPMSPASPAAGPPALCISLPEGPGPPPGGPAVSPSSTPTDSPRMQYQPSCSCRTQGAPKLPASGGGESCLHAQLPQALGLGSSMGVTVAVGAWGQQHCCRPDPFVPFVSQPGMGRESLWCPLSWQLVTGMMGLTPHCRVS